MGICDEEGCERQVHSRGKCQPHYRQWMRRERGLRKPGPAPDPSSRFSRHNPEGNKVPKGTRPKYFLGGTCRKGHLLTEDTVKIEGNGLSCKVCVQNNRRVKAGLEPLDTLFDQRKEPSLRERCNRGHEFTPENTYTRPNGVRACGVCNEQRQRRNRYGLSNEEFLALVEQQHGSCAICHTSFNERKMHVDHCHTTGAVRGLLCSQCNRAIGLLGDNAEGLERALLYLTKGIPT